MKKASSKGFKVYCHIHGPDQNGFGTVDSPRCLRCARIAKKARREAAAERKARRIGR